MIRIFLISTFILLISSQYYQKDLVTQVIANYTGHHWYSGFLNIGRGKDFHYVFFTSQHDPDNDPIVVWYNGGPGCSALLGMTTQIGPFLFPKNSTELVLNPYAWNKEANLLFIEAPGSVGFSTGPTQSSDQSTAEDNLQSLITFYSKFPIMKNNQMYISGQSYAGVYVPTLAKAIHQYNSHHDTFMKINFKGIIVGNACTHRSECYDPRPGVSLFQYQFLYNHGYYTTSDYKKMRASCVMDYRGQSCKTIRADLDKKFDATFSNLYGIYDKCYEPSNGQKTIISQSGNLKSGHDCNPHTGSEQFFNNPFIQDVLHVNQYFTGQWSACSEQVSKHYKKNENQSYSIYPILMQAGYRIWVYSGDTDADVPVTGTISWIQRLRQQFHVPIMQPWRQWWVYGKHAGEDQVGGMVWKLKNLTMVTIKNAGHMAPQDQPQTSLAMLSAFLKGKDLNQKYEI